MPKVSIIIIIYKVEQFLAECIESVISQTYDNLEIILVVGSDDEKCVEICKKYSERDTRIKLLVEKPEGTAVARNQGLDAVSGDYIAFVDGDDYVASDMIETMVNAALSHEADISVVGKYYLYENTVEGNDINEEYVYDLKEAFRTILHNDKFFLHMWDKLYKRELFDGLRFDAGKRVEDRQMAVKIISKTNKLVYNSGSKYYFRVSHDSGSKVSDNLKLSLDADYEICNDILLKFPDLSDIVEYFLMVENMSVIQSAFLYDVFSKDNNKDQIQFVRKHRKSVSSMDITGRGMKIKMMLCGYFPKIFKKITLSRRKQFLNTHIEFGSGNDWNTTFIKQNIN